MFYSTFLFQESRFFLGLVLTFFSLQNFAQSSNCATATQINLTSGTVCVNGTNVGAIPDNISSSICNSTSVNMVWYTYVTNGSNNTFTLDPGTMTDPEIVIYTGNCPLSAGGALQTCTTAAGGATIYTTCGIIAGIQVWIGIASTSLNDGTFQLCINSLPPTGAGSSCAQAIPICTMAAFSHTIITVNSSGQVSSCFDSAPQRDVWLKFNIAQSGILAWKANPTISSTEFDWTLWNITNNCPGSEVCCNYNYAGGSSVGFGMMAQSGTVACGYTIVSFSVQNEFSPPTNVNAGETYAIQISNYDNTSAGFTLSFMNSTCVIDCATGIIENKSTDYISVFPNPANNIINIKSKNELQKIELYTVTGGLLSIEEPNSNLHKINLDNYSNGIYFLKLYSNNQIIKNEKIIILK